VRLVNLNHHGTLGEDRSVNRDHVAAVEDAEQEDESIEELFGQLWAIPNPDKARVPNPTGGERRLVWIRKDLVREKRFRPEDCFPMGRILRFDGPPTRL
jgi:hypothetical protein